MLSACEGCPHYKMCKATVQYGENLQALSVALNTVGAVSVKRTHEILSGVFNIPLATGTISNMVKRCVDAVSETVNRIKQKLPIQVLVISMRPEPVLIKNYGGFMMHQTVNSRTLISVQSVDILAWSNAVVLPVFHGIAMHDCWASYWSYEDCQHAVCCAHLLRELTGIAENHPEQKWASAFLSITSWFRLITIRRNEI